MGWGGAGEGGREGEIVIEVDEVVKYVGRGKGGRRWR